LAFFLPFRALFGFLSKFSSGNPVYNLFEIFRKGLGTYFLLMNDAVKYCNVMLRFCLFFIETTKHLQAPVMLDVLSAAKE